MKLRWQLALGSVLLSLTVVAVSLGVSLLKAPAAEAGPGCPSGTGTPLGTSRWCGYFFNNKDTNGDPVITAGIPGWVVDAPSFIGFIQNTLQTGSARDRTGAAFIVLTMLGYGQGTSQATAAVGGAAWNDWVARVNSVAPYTIWNFAAPFPCNILNSYHQGTGGPDDAFYYEPAAAGRCGPAVKRPSILFRDSSLTPIFTIKRDCGNPIGSPGLSPLPPANWSLTGDLQPGSFTPAFGGVLQPGQAYALTPTVTNTSAVNSGAFDVEVQNMNPAYVAFSSMNTGVGVTGNGYLGAGCGPVIGSPCWDWQYGGGIGAGASVSVPDGAVFTVSAATPDGTNVCFQYVLNPQNNTGGGPLVRGPYCFVVYHPHYPQVLGQSGDVHAGGGICGQAQNPLGKVQGNGTAPSFGEYVVSAAGVVNSYGSNNSAAGQGATLGKTGGYNTVCRPDLVTTAQTYVNTGQATSVGGGSINLATLPPSLTDVYVLTTPGVHIHGTVNRKITLVSLAGTMFIDGNITLAAPVTTGDNAPSLGIISRGDIQIYGAATRVDAYLFSDGYIDTCMEGAVAACRNVLTVNGFLMARNLSFHRMGSASAPINPAGVAAEIINLTGQLYLNPPKLFDAAADVNLLQNQGERPPLN